MSLITLGMVLSAPAVSRLLAETHQEFKRIGGLVKGQTESLHFIYKANDVSKLAIRALSGAITVEQLQYILADIRHEYYRVADNHLAQSERIYYLQKALQTQAFINQLRGRKS